MYDAMQAYDVAVGAVAGVLILAPSIYYGAAMVMQQGRGENIQAAHARLWFKRSMLIGVTLLVAGVFYLV